MRHGINQPIKVISNGVITAKKIREKIKLNLPSHQYFLYIGRISVEKSLDILIQAFNLFAQDNKKVDLLLVGDGPAKNQLIKLVDELQLKQRVFFLGKISHSLLLNSNIYDHALAFATASKSETQCISVLEAMSHKLPIIGVKSRALPELIQKNGILCPPDNLKKIAQAFSIMASERKKRASFSQQSLRIANQHSLEKTVDQLEQVYQQLLMSRL
jgi:glycosyltransferase involved in cell wall biosynthesis